MKGECPIRTGEVMASSDHVAKTKAIQINGGEVYLEFNRKSVLVVCLDEEEAIQHA